MRYPAMALAILGIAACANDDHVRPATVEYLTEAVLIPSCAPAQCHSSFKQAEGLSFTTVDEARISINSMVDGSLVDVDEGNPDNALFYRVLVRTIDRMPFDQPMANADIELIREFIEIGAPNAQCNPANGELQCLSDKVYTCGADFNFADLVEDCSTIDLDPGQEGRCISGTCVAVDR